MLAELPGQQIGERALLRKANGYAVILCCTDLVL